MPTFHLLIKGIVQGVFYRATANEVAKKLNLTGWIKNTEQDNVEAIVTGNTQHLLEFINWCKQGPEKAKVEEVIITEEKEIFFDEFEIIS